MKISSFLIAVIVLAVSCKKERVEKPRPLPGFDMDYVDLSGKEIGWGQFAVIDLNKDGRKDITFSTELVGDPIAKQDKQQYMVHSGFFTSLPVDESESVPVQNKNEVIPVGNFGNYNWYNASSIILAQKIIPLTGDPYWIGNWKDSEHKYLPVQVMVDDKRYNGWVELSFDTETQKTILHRAAISRKAESEIKAGV